MTVTQHLHPGLDREQPLLGWGEQIAARQEVAGDGLGVAVQEWPTWAEWLAEMIANRRIRGRGLAIAGLSQRWIVGCDDGRLLYL
jgi:hypothetical protein